MGIRFWICLVALVVASAPAAPCDSPEQPLTNEMKLLDLATLWQEVNYNFVHFDLTPALDWNESFKTYSSQVLAAKTPIEHIRILQRFLAQLNEGHTNVVPDKKLWIQHAAHPPIDLNLIEGKPVVINTAKSLTDVLPIGSVIVEVETTPVDLYLDRFVLPYLSASTMPNRLSRAIHGNGEPAVGLLVGPPETKVSITFEAPDRVTRTLNLTRISPESEIDWLNPPKERSPVLSMRWLEEDIAWIELNTFQKAEVVKEFETKMPELKRAHAVILDVRKNTGGNSDHGWAIGSHFIAAPVAASRWRAREHVSVMKAWGRYKGFEKYRAYADMNAWKDGETDMVKPSSPAFDVPVAVLIGHDTYSAAEDFAAFATNAPGFILIGSPTAGSTGQPLVFQLPSKTGWAAITSKRDELPDGTRIIGRGIIPDIEVEMTLEDFREGRDPVLLRAVQELKKKLHR